MEGNNRNAKKPNLDDMDIGFRAPLFLEIGDVDGTKLLDTGTLGDFRSSLLRSTHQRSQRQAHLVRASGGSGMRVELGWSDS